MKKIIFSVLIVLFIANQSTTAGNIPFVYNLQIDKKIMHVKLNYIPVVTDSTVFQYGNFNGGMKDMMNSLINLHSKVKFRVDSANREITFYYKDKSPIEIKYDIIDTHKPQHKVVGEMFRPIITDNYFFSLTSTLFLTPINIDGKKYRDLKMSVTLQKKPAFPMYFSFAPEMKPGETINLNL